ncbi:hypothetical protein QQF64_011883 [Cirrhinus molitorella]|uniref:Transposase Tc1-like domain-containing protein n=1 Tax=Cirrhinus molitorella TaxID=172907 RepID=A0ABR3LY27_9TELE
MPRGTVFSIVKKFTETGEVTNLPGRGRKKKTTPRTDRLIRQLAMKNRNIPAEKIAAEVKKATDTELCAQTIRNRLNDIGLHGRIPRKKTLISGRDEIKRLQFAQEHINKSVEFWKSILWSDGQTKMWIEGGALKPEPLSDRVTPIDQVLTATTDRGAVQ